MLSVEVHMVVMVVVEMRLVSVPGVKVVLTSSDLCGGRMTSIQELLNDLVNVQNPSHQAVHLLVQAFKPTTYGIVGYEEQIQCVKRFQLGLK